MKSFKVISILALTLLLLTGGDSTAHARNMKNLSIYNNSGYTIKALYLVPFNQSNWGKEQINMLGYYSFPNKTSLKLSYNADYTKWKMRIVFNNGATREWSQTNNYVNLSGAYKLTIVSDGKSGSVENFRWQKN